MFPKIIWQGFISVRGYDKAMRVVQIAEHEAIVEWAPHRDSMGNQAWCEFDEWYGTLVGDLMRNAVATTHAALNVHHKIGLIKLVREATKQFAKDRGVPSEFGADHVPCMGLGDAKRFVEEWLRERGLNDN